MRSAMLAAGSSLLALTPPSSAWAAAPGSLASPGSSLVLADPQLLPMMPGPIAFPRRQMENNFAVLLLRSSYDALDDLDFCAMVGRRGEGGGGTVGGDWRHAHTCSCAYPLC